jgi:SEC-C motif
MPRTGLLITCQHCGYVWNDGDNGAAIFGFENVNVALENIATNCPRCGNFTSMPNGNYEVREGAWRLVRRLTEDLRSAQANQGEWDKLLRLLKQAQASGQSNGQAADEITAQTPFTRLAETLRDHPIAAWMIPIIISVVLAIISPMIGIGATSPGTTQVSLQDLSPHELNELARQIAQKLQSENIGSIDTHSIALPQKGTQRNKPCPCGSGIKYKKCCGAPAPVHKH